MFYFYDKQIKQRIVYNSQNIKKMFQISVVLLLLFTAKTGCENLMFRFDYTFSEEADGWLKFQQMPVKWNDAKDRCQSEGAVLASPLTITLRKAILKFVADKKIPTIFTGVHATFSQGDYSSVEGVELSWLPITWAPGEPDNVDNSESCLAMMTKDGTMADVKCDNALTYVCFKKRTELTITQCGTDDKEYKLDARTGNCYKFHRRGLPWSKAYSTCAAEGAHLAIINSQEEASILRDIWSQFTDDEVIGKDKGVAFVGIRDLRDGGSWLTIHGQTLIDAGYNRWGGNQPDNYTVLYPEGESCGTIFKDGVYNDACCCITAPFICEKSMNSLLDL